MFLFYFLKRTKSTFFFIIFFSNTSIHYFKLLTRFSTVNKSVSNKKFQTRLFMLLSSNTLFHVYMFGLPDETAKQLRANIEHNIATQNSIIHSSSFCSNIVCKNDDLSVRSIGYGASRFNTLAKRGIMARRYRGGAVYTRIC